MKSKQVINRIEEEMRKLKEQVFEQDTSGEEFERLRVWLGGMKACIDIIKEMEGEIK